MATIEYVLLVVDIEDSRAQRLARQRSERHRDDFFFMFPQEYYEYDPEQFFVLLDESIIKSSDFEKEKKQIQRAFSYGEAKEYNFKNLDGVFKHFSQVLIFCKGSSAMTEIELDLVDFQKINPRVERLGTRKCDPEYDSFEELVGFRTFAERILQSVRARK